jgi:hypothetical protein
MRFGRIVSPNRIHVPSGPPGPTPLSPPFTRPGPEIPTAPPRTLGPVSTPEPPRTEQPAPPEPWWQTRIARFGILLASLAALILAPIHLTPTGALVTGIVGFCLVAALALTSVRRLVLRVRKRAVSELEALEGRAPVRRSSRDVRTLVDVVRTAGIAVPALLFFLAWATLYAVIWAADPNACAVATAHCDGAFTGIGHRPLLGDFVYYAVNIGFANPPPDVVAESRPARAAATVEIVAAAAFLFTYLGAFMTTRTAARGSA